MWQPFEPIPDTWGNNERRARHQLFFETSDMFPAWAMCGGLSDRVDDQFTVGVAVLATALNVFNVVHAHAEKQQSNLETSAGSAIGVRSIRTGSSIGDA